MLFMKTAMTSGTLQKNKIAISSDEVTKDVTAQYKLADVGGDTGVTTKGKLKIVKQDSETGTGLAGCGNKEKPKQYVAELSNPYVNTLPSLNKELDINYQFQNTLSK